MRFLFAIFCVLVTVGNVWAQELLTECPAGYIAISEPGVVLDAEKCPDKTIMLSDDIPSCLAEDPSDLCAMYAESKVTYTDEKGSFHYEGICEM